VRLIGDLGGSVITSTNPTAANTTGAGPGSGATWTKKLVDTTNAIDAMSYPSTSLCVAVDDKGNILTSTDPGDGSSAVWASENVDGNKIIDDVSCPTTTLCVAVDDAGNPHRDRSERRRHGDLERASSRRHHHRHKQRVVSLLVVVRRD
jgi:hypothetical protein